MRIWMIGVVFGTLASQAPATWASGTCGLPALAKVFSEKCVSVNDARLSRVEGGSILDDIFARPELVELLDAESLGALKSAIQEQVAAKQGTGAQQEIVCNNGGCTPKVVVNSSAK